MGSLWTRHSTTGRRRWGATPANGYGVHDMIGNVRQWTRTR
ncbi:SUMF1/EgtB/PvdO family nonheme iron enzyme [Nocardioides sp. URHA0032]